MKTTVSTLFVILAGFLRLAASEEQAFFLTHVSNASRVTITLRPEHEGPLSVILDTTEKKKIEQVVSAIEMEDRKPEKSASGEEIITGSVLTFGVADYIITFFHDDKKVGEYGMQQDRTFITPLGEHASKSFIDLPLSEKSSATMKRLLAALKKTPSQMPEPTSDDVAHR